MVVNTSARYKTYTAQIVYVFDVIPVRFYEVSLCIQSEWGKMPTRITPNTDTFYAVLMFPEHVHRS